MQNTPPELARDTLRLISYFERAERAILQTLTRRSRLGDSTRRERDRKLLEVRGVLSELSRAINDGGESSPLWSLVRTAYRTGARRAEEGLERSSIPGTKRGFGGMHQEAAKVFFDRLSGNLDDATRHAQRRVEDNMKRATLDELMVSQIAGRDRRQTSKAVEGQLREKGVEGFTDKRGREWSLSDYAEMSVVTVSREAHTQGTLNRLAENGFDLVVISTNPPSKPPCDRYCKRQEAKVYSIGGESDEHPKLEERPPFHPFCRHVLSAYIEGLN